MASSPILVIAEKEFADAVRSKRLWGLTIVMLALFGLMIFSFTMGQTQITAEGEVVRIDPVTQILIGLTASINLVAPLLGLSLGYDAISGEREKGTIRLLLSRPIYRDQVINGKSLSALVTITFALGLSTMVLVGLSSVMLGAALDLDLMARITLYVLLAVLLAFVYYSISLLISTASRRSSRSLMLSLLVWILFTFVIPLIGFFVAMTMVGPMPPAENEEAIREWTRRVAEITENINLVVPNTHFSKIADNLLRARIKLGEMFGEFETVPTTIGEVFLHGWVNLAVLILYAVAPYAASYAIFTSSEKE